MPETSELNGDLAARLDAILRAAPNLMTVLGIARDLDLPDWLLVSGAIYQPVLNHLTGRPLDFGIKDYDLAYFDGSNLSYAAEDAVIRGAAAAFPPPLRDMVEVRNQARVHLWFEDHYGEAYAPLSRSAEALSRFTAPLFAVGVRLEPDGGLHVEAPFGLEDLFGLRLRPNPVRRTNGFADTAARAVARWPEITVEV
jgi:uncharacterized protein